MGPGASWPNTSVKGTRRTQAFVKVCFYNPGLWLRYSSVSGAPLTFTLGTMPHHLFIACVILTASLIVHAALAPFYETGIHVYVSPIIFFGVSVFFLAFIKKRLWSWQFAKVSSFWLVVIHSLFPPTSEFYGGLTFFAQVLFIVEATASSVIFLSMFTTTTKVWFFESKS